MRYSATLQASLALFHLSNLSCLATPAPTAKSYLNRNTHQEAKSNLIHFSKGKVGDNQVLHALLNDPNVAKVHHVLNGLDNPQAAHANLEHYLERHVEDSSRVHVYKTPNHLHEAEHHESVFDTHNENKTPVQLKRPLFDFEKDLGSKLQEGGHTWVHSTAPTSLWHLEHVAKETKAKNMHLSHINLSVGHNSQQYHPDPNQKLPTEGLYLTHAQDMIREYHPNADIRFHNTRMSFPFSQATSLNRLADETVDLLHPTTQKQIKKDIFHGPTIEKIHEHLHQFQEEGAIHPDFPVIDPHPQVFKDANIPLRDAVGQMLTTKDKTGEDLQRVLKGRKHFAKFLHAAPLAMKQALASGRVTGDRARSTRKRLDRIDTPQFRAKFRGNDPIPVEMGDPIALAAHRQAYHNKGNASGPKYEPIHFTETGNRWIANVAQPGEKVHGQGLFDADSNEAFADHKNIVKNGKQIGYIEGSGHWP